MLPASNYFSAVQFGTPGIEFLHIEAEYTALHSHPNKVKDVKALLSPMKLLKASRSVSLNTTNMALYRCGAMVFREKNSHSDVQVGGG